MMSNGRMVKSLKLKLRIFGALAGMTSLLITLLPTYVQAAPDPVPWEEDTDSTHYVMKDLPGGTDTLVNEYKGTKTNLKIPAQLNGKTVVLQPGFNLNDSECGSAGRFQCEGEGSYEYQQVVCELLQGIENLF